MTSGEELMHQLEALHKDAYGWAVACCGGEAERARDVLQDAYVKVATERAVFGGRSALKTWWFGVVRLTAMESGRRQRRWRTAIHALPETFDSSFAPNETAMSGDMSGCEPGVLRAALKQLAQRQAEVLHLVFYQGLSITEAAVVMNVSVGSARRHYERGKQRLRRELLSARAHTTSGHERPRSQTSL
jgi:RNA polymerase sigma-70 factor (ECF subfamily)